MTLSEVDLQMCRRVGSRSPCLGLTVSEIPVSAYRYRGRGCVPSSQTWDSHAGARAWVGEGSLNPGPHRGPGVRYVFLEVSVRGGTPRTTDRFSTGHSFGFLTTPDPNTVGANRIFPFHLGLTALPAHAGDHPWRTIPRFPSVLSTL